MRVLLIMLVLFVGCKSFKDFHSQNDTPLDLAMLSQYPREIERDTVQDESIVRYKTLDVVVHWKSKQVLVEINGAQSFECDLDNRSFQFEVYKYRYLLISVIQGGDHSAGPDDVDRSTTVIIDINSGLVKTVNLKTVKLTRSVEFLNDLYRPGANNKLSNRYIVKSIDVYNDQITLLNRNGQTIVIPLKSSDKKYICI